MTRRIHIAVASPSAIIRSGLASIFKRMSSPGADVAELTDWVDFPRRLRSINPDVLIVDVSHIGTQASSSIRTDIGMSSLKIVAMLTSAADASVLRYFDASISLYDTPESIKEKIIRMMETEEPDDSKQELSQREKEIIVCVVKGMTNKQIAEMLNISAHTVITHRRNIVSKLSIHSTAGLTIYAIVNKLIEIDQIKDAIYMEEQ